MSFWRTGINPFEMQLRQKSPSLCKGEEPTFRGCLSWLHNYRVSSRSEKFVFTLGKAN